MSTSPDPRPQGPPVRSRLVSHFSQHLQMTFELLANKSEHGENCEATFANCDHAAASHTADLTFPVRVSCLSAQVAVLGKRKDVVLRRVC